MNYYEKSIINLDLNNQNLNVILGCTNEIVQNVLTHSIKKNQIEISFGNNFFEFFYPSSQRL